MAIISRRYLLRNEQNEDSMRVAGNTWLDVSKQKQKRNEKNIIRSHPRAHTRKARISTALRGCVSWARHSSRRLTPDTAARWNFSLAGSLQVPLGKEGRTGTSYNPGAECGQPCRTTCRSTQRKVEQQANRHVLLLPLIRGSHDGETLIDDPYCGKHSLGEVRISAECGYQSVAATRTRVE